MGITFYLKKLDDALFEYFTKEEAYKKNNLKREYNYTWDINGIINDKILWYGDVKILEDRFSHLKLNFIEIKPFSRKDSFFYIVDNLEEIKAKLEKDIEQWRELIKRVKKELLGIKHELHIIEDINYYKEIGYELTIKIIFEYWQRTIVFKGKEDINKLIYETFKKNI